MKTLRHFLALGLLLCLLRADAAANNYVVSNASGSLVAGSLRQALQDAAGNPGADTITFAGVFTAAAQTITLTSEITVSDAGGVTVDASALPYGVTISGGGATRLFSVAASGNLTLRGLTLTGGNGSAMVEATRGGAIHNLGAVALESCTLSGNSSVPLSGGAIWTTGTATLTQCTLSANTSGNWGGAIVSAGTTTLTHCTISGNTAANFGGGIFSNRGNTTLTYCIVSGNTATNGSDIWSNGAADATASGPPGGITRVGANVIRFAGKNPDGPDSGPAAIAADPLLGPLVDNGGLTKTMALLAYSQAIDAGGNLTTLNGAIDNSVASITLTDASAVPAGAGSVIQIDSEQMMVTGKSANILTVNRHANGTIAAAHNHGAAVNLALDQRGSGFARSLGSGPDLGAYESGDANFMATGLTLYARVPADLIGTGVFFEISDNAAFSVPSNVGTLVGPANAAGVFGSADGTRQSATLGYPSGVAQDSLGNIFIADSGNNLIRMLDGNGMVSTIAGNGTYGLANGPGLSAEFAFPSAIAVGPDDNLYVADTYNHRICKLTRPASEGQQWTVTTMAGTGTSGFLNGAGSVARFYYPYGLDLDASSNVYVADALNHRIRKVTPAGTVTTFAGSGATSVTLTNCVTNGTTTVTCSSTAAVAAGSSISGPDIAAGTTIASVMDGVTLVLSAAATGSHSALSLNVISEGTKTQANFDVPYGVAFDSHGNLFVADGDHQRIRKIDQTTGLVSTFAGSGVAGRALTNCTTSTAGPGTTVTCASTANLLAGVSIKGTNIAAATTVLSITDPTHFVLSKPATGNGSSLTLTAAGPVDGTGSAANFYTPAALAFDGDDNLYVSDQDNNAIRKITPARVVTTVAGLGIAGFSNGGISQAEFNAPAGLLVARDGTIVVADTENHLLRNIAVGPLRVPAIADPGNVNGVGEQLSAVLNLALLGLNVGTPGTRYYFRYRLPDGSTHAMGQSFTLVELPIVVTVAADSLTPTAGRLKGTVNPKTLVTKAALEYSTEPTLLPPYLVTPLAGTALADGSGVVGFADAPTASFAKFHTPEGLVVSGGNVYVADLLNHSIRKLSAVGAVTTFAGAVSLPDGSSTPGFSDATGAAARFDHPAGIVAEPDLVLLNCATVYATTTVTCASTTGLVPGAGISGTNIAVGTTIASVTNATTFVISANATGSSTGLTLTAGGANFYVADEYNHRIRKVTASGQVTTLAGSGIAGFADGAKDVAKFLFPTGVALDSAVPPNVYVADSGNHCIRKVASNGTVSTFAGTGISGFANGVVTAAQFASPQGVAVNSAGDVLVADTGNHLIRVISGGSVATFAGSTQGFRDGPGASAMFSSPTGIAVVADGTSFVTDSGNHRIRRIGADAVVGTYAGSGIAGAANSPASGLYPILATQFNFPVGIAVDGAGGVLVTQEGLVRKIARGALPTVAWPATLSGNSAVDIFGDVSGLLPGATYYFRAKGTCPQATVTGNIFSFTTPTAPITVNAGPTIADAEVLNGQAAPVDFGETPLGTPVVRQFTISNPNGKPLTVTAINVPSGYQLTGGTGVNVIPAGGTLIFAVKLSANATGGTKSGNVVINSDAPGLGTFVFPITGIVLAPPAVTTLAATANGGGNATLNGTVNPLGSATDVWFQWSLTGQFDGVDVTTVAGSSPGYAEGLGVAAKFNQPSGMAADAAGNIFVADTQNHRIRKIAVDGTVTTFAGTGVAGFLDGPAVASDPANSAQFNLPVGLVFGAGGTLFVTDFGNNRIRAITPGGVVRTYAGFVGGPGFTDGVASAARFSAPWGVSIDSAGILYVADRDNHRIRKVATDGSVTTLAGTGVAGMANTDTALGIPAQFDRPLGIAVDAAGFTYVTEAASHAIRRIAPDGTTSVFAGAAATPGLVNGTAAASRFTNPLGLAVDGGGSIFVADRSNHSIRKITSTIGFGGAVSVNVVTFAGLGTPGAVDGKKNVAQFDTPISVLATADRGAVVGGLTNATIRRIVPSEPLLAAATGLAGTNVLPVALPVTGLTIGNTYYYRAVATNVRGTNYGNSFSILAGTPFELWQLANFVGPNATDPLVRDESATPAHDGITNRVKYALGLNPFADSVGSLPVVAINGGNLTLTYNKVLAATDILYTVEWSADLIAWQTTGITQQASPPTATTQQFVASIPIAPQRVKFLRLTITFLAP